MQLRGPRCHLRGAAGAGRRSPRQGAPPPLRPPTCASVGCGAGGRAAPRVSFHTRGPAHKSVCGVWVMGLERAFWCRIFDGTHGRALTLRLSHDSRADAGALRCTHGRVASGALRVCSVAGPPRRRRRRRPRRCTWACSQSWATGPCAAYLRPRTRRVLPASAKSCRHKCTMVRSTRLPTVHPQRPFRRPSLAELFPPSTGYLSG